MKRKKAKISKAKDISNKKNTNKPYIRALKRKKREMLSAKSVNNTNRSHRVNRFSRLVGIENLCILVHSRFYLGDTASLADS